MFKNFFEKNLMTYPFSVLRNACINGVRYKWDPNNNYIHYKSKDIMSSYTNLVVFKSSSNQNDLKYKEFQSQKKNPRNFQLNMLENQQLLIYIVYFFRVTFFWTKMIGSDEIITYISRNHWLFGFLWFYGSCFNRYISELLWESQKFWKK